MSPENLATWSNELEADGVRLVAFKRWLRVNLAERLIWPMDERRKLRQVGQCAAFVEKAVADLARRGWLFRPAELAKLLTDQLDHIASYQRVSHVHDLYKYLERAWDNWSGRNAEELAQAAREQGVHRAHMSASLPVSLPEILLRNLEAADREVKAGRALRTAAKRARKGHCSADAGQLPLGI